MGDTPFKLVKGGLSQGANTFYVTRTGKDGKPENVPLHGVRDSEDQDKIRITHVHVDYDKWTPVSSGFTLVLKGNDIDPVSANAYFASDSGKKAIASALKDAEDAKKRIPTGKEAYEISDDAKLVHVKTTEPIKKAPPLAKQRFAVIPEEEFEGKTITVAVRDKGKVMDALHFKGKVNDKAFVVTEIYVGEGKWQATPSFSLPMSGDNIDIKKANEWLDSKDGKAILEKANTVGGSKEKEVSMNNASLPRERPISTGRDFC